MLLLSDRSTDRKFSVRAVSVALPFSLFSTCAFCPEWNRSIMSLRRFTSTDINSSSGIIANSVAAFSIAADITGQANRIVININICRFIIFIYVVCFYKYTYYWTVHKCCRIFYTMFGFLNTGRTFPKARAVNLSLYYEYSFP